MRRIDLHRFMPVQVESPRLAARDVSFLYHFVTVKDIPPARSPTSKPSRLGPPSEQYRALQRASESSHASAGEG